MNIELIRTALRRAYHLGQTYWQQADSEFTSQHKKADATQRMFKELVDETCQAIEQAEKLEPVAYECPKGCGCWWRDNRDGTMSLFNGDHRSCSICENLPLNDLKLVSLADHLFIEHRDGDNWLVCVERVFKGEAEARKACQKWKDYTYPSTTPAQQTEKQEPVAYLAWRNGEPCYAGEDAVCGDAVWPCDADDDRTSMPVYLHPTAHTDHIPGVRKMVHTDHPLRHYDRTCPACNEAQPDETYQQAKRLAEALFKTHYASDDDYASGRIVWEVQDTTLGVLTQIDNMVCGLVKAPAQPLTNEAISDMMEIADAKWADADVDFNWARYFARAIEAHIKGETK